MVLELADMDPDLIPADLDEGVVTVSVPEMVQMHTTQVDIVQMPSPAVEYPEGINPGTFGEAGLRLLGLSPAEARSISESIDWASTLVLPIPADVAEFQELQIAGAEGVLLQPRQTDAQNVRTLLWEKDGILYVIGAHLGYEELVQVAESMF